MKAKRYHTHNGKTTDLNSIAQISTDGVDVRVVYSWGTLEKISLKDDGDKGAKLLAAFRAWAGDQDADPNPPVPSPTVPAVEYRPTQTQAKAVSQTKLHPKK